MLQLILIIALANTTAFGYLFSTSHIHSACHYRTHRNRYGYSGVVRAVPEPKVKGSYKEKIVPAVATASLFTAAIVSKMGVLEGFDIDQYISSVVEHIHELGTFGYVYFALVKDLNHFTNNFPAIPPVYPCITRCRLI
jgi:hypothetical protein